MKIDVNPVKCRLVAISPRAKLFHRVNRLRIGFDFDGVIIDHTNSKIAKAKELGFDIKPHQTPSNRLENIIDPYYYRQIQKHIYNVATVRDPIVYGAKKTLETLKNKGHDMFVISSRPLEQQAIVLEWLKKHLPHMFKKQHIVFAGKESLKDSVCRKLGIGVYLDDKVSVLKQLVNVPYMYLYDPYNIGNDFDLGKIQPVSSWQEFLSLTLQASLTLQGRVRDA